MDLYENRSEKSLKGDQSNDTTDNPPFFSLVNTFKLTDGRRRGVGGEGVGEELNHTIVRNPGPL
jgi:hypothetical protein